MQKSRRTRRFQRGQAIVIIALMLGVLVGMAALAIDGSRAYGLRRDLQTAVDSAALAAGDRLEENGSYSSAERAGATIFGTNMRLYVAPSCSPGYGAPTAAPWTLTCTYSDGTTLTEAVSSLGPQGSQFSMTASRALVLQFGRILTNGVSPAIGATATSRVSNLLYSPAIVALDQAGCGGLGGNAISMSGSGTLDVRGDVVSNGSISDPSTTAIVSGDVYASCQSSLPGSMSTDCYPSDMSPPCSWPDVIGAVRTGYTFTDPNYPLPAVSGGSRSSPTNIAVIQSGTYASDPRFDDGQCWFAAGGVYKFTSGLSITKDFLSNELKPPAEPQVMDNTVKAANQFWNTNGMNCAGDFKLTAVGGSPIPTGTWAVELTSTRTDSYAGTSYGRESAPSYCQTVAVAAGQVIQIQVSNLPGATGYNVYVAPPGNGCAGPFGLAGSIAVSGSVLNDNTGGCPSYTAGSCSLGFESAIFDSTLLGALFAPNPLAAADTVGAYPPDSETAAFNISLPNQNAARATPPHGDRANENQCETSAAVAASCPASITPGAVVFYIPSGGCLAINTSGDAYVFSGYQYDWMSLYEPGNGHAPANTCSNDYDADSNSSFVGLFYTPAATLTIPTKFSSRTEQTGGFIVDSVRFQTGGPLIISSRDYAPVPPASRLVA